MILGTFFSQLLLCQHCTERHHKPSSIMGEGPNITTKKNTGIRMRVEFMTRKDRFHMEQGGRTQMKIRNKMMISELVGHKQMRSKIVDDASWANHQPIVAILLGSLLSATSIASLIVKSGFAGVIQGTFCMVVPMMAMIRCNLFNREDSNAALSATLAIPLSYHKNLCKSCHIHHRTFHRSMLGSSNLCCQ